MLFRRALIIALVLYAAYFLGGAVLAPLMAHNHQLENADYFYGLFSASCQQQASRTFWLWGYPMALCVRCVGVYSGFIVTGALSLKQSGTVKVNKGLLGVLLVAGLGEKLMEWFLWEANNWIRLVSGAALGAFLMLLVVLTVQLIWRKFSKHESEEIVVPGH